MFSGDARFLVVDDTVAARDGIRKTLNKLGFVNVDEAEDGRDAIEKIKNAASDSRPYAVVFLDLNMPEMDGLKTLEVIRRDPNIQGTPVVVVTTESAKPTVISAVMKGVSGYIVKPFSPDDIKKKVIEIFQRSQQESNVH